MIGLLSIEDTIDCLKDEQVIAYPTESIFGLGCDPDSEQAVTALLKIKQRSVEKGLILIADHYEQLLPYIDDSQLDCKQKEQIFASWPGPVTWIMPKNQQTPYFLTGQFHSIAVRVTAHPLVKSLCYQYGKPIVSTSANLSGYEPCKTEAEIWQQFGHNFPILHGNLGGGSQPSQIRDSRTGHIIRS
ncbi:Sua5/YciO/YrdC/YwlC family protein [Utexia brackfieldae]|uniref:Sua5/YciO/YrdC/YwlC family protein n=1 Tax=Utexia brackfieldae TaxID=3074108 RepID=UPI00370D7DD0